MITVTIDGKKYEIPMPKGMSLREQHPDCNNKGCVCSVFDGNLVCAKVTLKPESDGSFSFFELNPCSKGNGKVMEIE